MIGARERAAIRSALRRVWQFGPDRRAAKARAKGPRGLGWVCQACRTFTPAPEVDHKEPVGPTPGARGSGDATWDGFMARMFCGADGLRVLCRNCHLQVSAAGRNVRPKPPSVKAPK